MRLPEIVGIAGTNGSGKDTLADLRLERENARKASLSDILRVEATRLGLEHSRENLRSISSRLGKELGAGALSLSTIAEFTSSRRPDETGLSIVSIRRPDEAEAIQGQGGSIIWVDAPLEVRYERVMSGSRGRVDDSVNLEEFQAQEAIEMVNATQNPFSLNMTGVREVANIHMTNTFKSVEEYKAHLVSTFELR